MSSKILRFQFLYQGATNALLVLIFKSHGSVGGCIGGASRLFQGSVGGCIGGARLFHGFGLFAILFIVYYRYSVTVHIGSWNRRFRCQLLISFNPKTSISL